MHRRISTFTRPSDDDDGHPTAWRLQCSPLIMALIFNRYERHQPGEHDQRTHFGILNWDTPTRLPGNATPSSPDVSLPSASLITSSNWQTKTTMGSDHLPILISLQMAPSSTPSLHRNYVNLKKANWERYSKDIEEALSTEPNPTDCQQGEKILRAAILKAASHHIPSGRHKLDHTEALPADIVDMVSARNDLRSRDPTSTKIAGSQLPLNRRPKILGVHLDTSLTFNVHCTQAATRVSNRNNVLKALAGTTWGQQKETILMTYKAIGRSVANYSAPVWSTNASATSIGKIQIAQNEALRIATGSHKMSSIDHLHNETEMLTVKQHSDLLSAQYLVQCLDPDHVCHNITTMDVPPRQMKHTLHTRHYPTVQPMLAATKKEMLQAVHTEAVTRAINSQQPNRVLHNRPPPISLEEDTLRRPQRTTLSQLRSGHCRLLNSYQNRLKQTVDPRCPDCGVNPHDVPSLFNCTAHPNALSTVNLWDSLSSRLGS